MGGFWAVSRAEMEEREKGRAGWIGEDRGEAAEMGAGVGWFGSVG